MHKFGLLLILANIFLKLVLGIGLWKMALDFKTGNDNGLKNSDNYGEERIEGGDDPVM